MGLFEGHMCEGCGRVYRSPWATSEEVRGRRYDPLPPPGWFILQRVNSAPWGGLEERLEFCSVECIALWKPSEPVCAACGTALHPGSPAYRAIEMIGVAGNTRRFCSLACAESPLQGEQDAPRTPQ